MPILHKNPGPKRVFINIIICIFINTNFTAIECIYPIDAKCYLELFHHLYRRFTVFSKCWMVKNIYSNFFHDKVILTKQSCFLLEPTIL